MNNAFWSLLRKELLLAVRQKTDVVTVLFFFLIVSSLFPFAVGPESNTLKLIGPGVIWVGALLCSLLALHRVFEADYNDGSLEHLILSGEPLTILVLAKIILIGSIGAGLTLGVRGGSALTSILILPFYVPILIFGAGAVVADLQGLTIDGHISILVAMLCLSVALAPLAIAGAIKIALE